MRVQTTAASPDFFITLNGTRAMTAVYLLLLRASLSIVQPGAIPVASQRANTGVGGKSQWYCVYQNVV